MVFEYNEYFNGVFISPIILMMLGMLFFLIEVISPTTKKNFFWSLLGLVLAVTFFTGGLFPFKHGVPLLHEKEDAKIECVGEITGFARARGDARYLYHDGMVQACYIFIDGEKYYIMYKGDLKVGDEVQFEYLPESRIILSIEEIGDEQ